MVAVEWLQLSKLNLMLRQVIKFTMESQYSIVKLQPIEISFKTFQE